MIHPPSPLTFDPTTATLMAGVPAINSALYRKIRFSVPDPAVLLELPTDNANFQTLLILRDIELERARQHAHVDKVACPADFAPEAGLSGDRETATAQAAVECLRRAGIHRVVGDRTVPLLVVDLLLEAGIQIVCDHDMGVSDRRSKDQQETDWLRQSQQVTELAIEMACTMIARATPGTHGVLLKDGLPLTSERVRAEIDHFLLEQNFSNPPSIVAGGPAGGDCHELGHGELRTGQPVVIDIFPCHRDTRYVGDCTRTVVHGEIPDAVAKMHSAVMAAKKAAIGSVQAGVTGEDVHRAAIEIICEHGYALGLPQKDDDPAYCAMTHGTGHGVGLDVHEPPLLDFNGPELVAGDALTIEPGLYCRGIGGVRVEDMVIVTDDGCENFNTLPAGLSWS